jgi:hypothetical protein
LTERVAAAPGTPRTRPATAVKYSTRACSSHVSRVAATT